MRKIWCEIIESACYEDRCLFKLSKIIEGNKVCEDCILREAEKLKETGPKKKKKAKSGPKKRLRSEKESKDAQNKTE